MGNRPHVTVTPRSLTSSTLHTPASNTAAVVTLPAVAGWRYAIQTILWSYNGTPTSGGLAITDAAVSQLDVDITAGGPGALPLSWVFGENAAVVVTLDAGGPGVTGRLTVRHYMVRA